MEPTKQRVLLLTYFFPPCNLTASQRIYAWAKYLGDYGYYPVIITRNWDLPISKPADVLKNSGDEIKIDQHEGYEVHYLPYRASVRDRVYNRFSGTPLSWLSKVFTAAELFTLGFSNLFTAHFNIYKYAKHYLQQNKDINKVVASGKPFDLFKFGYLLHENMGVKWIADYRDPWNSQPHELRRHNLSEAFTLHQDQLEKKWVSTASRIVTVSKSILDGIQTIVPIQGGVVMNGFFENEYPAAQVSDIAVPDRSVFRILHVGSLPEEVNIEMVVEGFKKLADKYKGKCKIEMDFAGVNFIPIVGKRIRAVSKGYEENILTSDRMSRQQIFERQSACQMLLMCGHNFKGYPSSKIFEYVGIGKPVVLAPSDNDIMEEILTDTNQAVVCANADQMLERISVVVDRFIVTGTTGVMVNMDKRLKYTRKLQTQELAEILNSL